jgi:hypothetical protein
VQVPNFVAKRWHAACIESANGTENIGAELGIVRIDTSGAVSFQFVHPYPFHCKSPRGF